MSTKQQITACQVPVVSGPAYAVTVEKKDFQKPMTERDVSPPRTLKTLKDGLQNYNEDGSVLSRAKLLNNVIRPVILPVLIMDACIPALHLDLGIFPYLYDAMLADARDLDIKLAKLIDNVDDSGTEFRTVRTLLFYLPSRSLPRHAYCVTG